MQHPLYLNLLVFCYRYFKFLQELTKGAESGAHDAALNALKCLCEADACFGFAATNTTVNTVYLGTDAFIDLMVKLGCSVGFFTEYVPCGLNPRMEHPAEIEGLAAQFENHNS